MVQSIRHLLYADQLRRLKLPSQRYRRDRGGMITVYQLLNGNMRMDPAHFISLYPGDIPTRGHSMKLKKPTANKAIRQWCFSRPIVDLWNSLPEAVINAQSVNDFKKELDVSSEADVLPMNIFYFQLERENYSWLFRNLPISRKTSISGKT